MTTEKVGTDAWSCLDCPYDYGGCFEDPVCMEDDAEDSAMATKRKGVFLTTAELDTLVAAAEAFSPTCKQENVFQEKVCELLKPQCGGPGEDTCLCSMAEDICIAFDETFDAAQAHTQRQRDEAPKGPTGVSCSKCYKEMLWDGGVFRCMACIRTEALEEARTYLREAAEHISPEGGGNLLIQAGDAILALRKETP